MGEKVFDDMGQFQRRVVIVGDEFDQQQTGILQQFWQQMLNNQCWEDDVELGVVVLKGNQSEQILKRCVQLLHFDEMNDQGLIHFDFQFPLVDLQLL